MRILHQTRRFRPHSQITHLTDDEYANRIPNPARIPKYTKVKVLPTRQLSSFTELHCHCSCHIKSIAAADLPEYVATHSHQTGYLLPCELDTENHTVLHGARRRPAKRGLGILIGHCEPRIYAPNSETICNRYCTHTAKIYISLRAKDWRVDISTVQVQYLAYSTRHFAQVMMSFSVEYRGPPSLQNTSKSCKFQQKSPTQ